METETYEQIVKGLKREAMKIRKQIEDTRNPIRKQRLLNEYSKLIQFLALKPKQAFLCRCGIVEFYMTKTHGIEIEHRGKECLIILL